MALRCPKCGSERIRRGYTQPVLPLRLLGLRALLCDRCNLVYTSFALSGDLRKSTRGKDKHKKRREKDASADDGGITTGEERRHRRAPAEGSRRERGVSSWQVFRFLLYYTNLRLRVLFGFYQTSHSLKLKRRWREWKHWQSS